MICDQDRQANAVLVGRLAVERCRVKVAHLHALLHLSVPPAFRDEGRVTQNARALLESLERELVCTADAFNQFQ